MSIDEARWEAIINKLKELEEFLEPEGAHFVLHLFTSRDVTEESYSLYNNCSLKILAMSQARIENYIEQLGKISLKHHKENVELMKLVDKLIESIQSGKELSTELEGDMIELLKALVELGCDLKGYVETVRTYNAAGELIRTEAELQIDTAGSI